MSQSKTRLLELNSRLAQNLTEKGVEATADETTTELVNKVAEISNDDSYYDTFWDTFQRNGERVNYHSAFSEEWSEEWSLETFIPKYDIVASGFSDMFYKFGLSIDLIELSKKQGIKIEFCITSSTTSSKSAFRYSNIVAVPKCCFAVGTAYTIQTVYANTGRLETIEKLIVDRYNAFSDVFAKAAALKNITIEGEIGSTFDIHYSPLTTESAKSIITHLVNYAGTDNEYVYSVVFNDSVWELLNAEGATAPGDITWEEYINSIGWNK